MFVLFAADNEERWHTVFLSVHGSCVTRLSGREISGSIDQSILPEYWSIQRVVDFGVRYAKLFEIYNSTRLQKRRCDKTIFPRSLRNIYKGNLNDTTYSSDISYYNFFYSIYSIRSMGIMRLSSQMHSTGRFELVPRSIWASRIEPNYFFYK